MDYQPPIILSGYEIPAEVEERTPLDSPNLSVGYTLEQDKTTVGTNLPLIQVYDNGDLNLFALFIFGTGDRVDYSAALTLDIYDRGLFEVSVGGGVAYIDERFNPSLNLNTALELDASNRLEVNSFYDFDSVYTSVGYGYTF